MKHFKLKLAVAVVSSALLSSCLKSELKTIEVSKIDTLIINGQVYTGEVENAQNLDIAVCQQVICGISDPKKRNEYSAKKIIDAQGKIVSPGFIDPHTHSLTELLSKDKNHNLNYLTQGVTTVVNGNDGGGPVDIKKVSKQLTANGIGTNIALYVGHGSLREKVIGREQRFATPAELLAMQTLLAQGMKDGAIGLSTGLYYVPGSYANTDEVIALAKVASQYNGVYDTHLRDESTFTVGFISALDEAINIAKQANIHLHLAHIKALGVDVWGQSNTAIAKIEQAQRAGVSISADQYPWLASGTKLRSAVMPKWLMADSKAAFHQRLNHLDFADRITAEISENIRRRGGPEALYITEFKDPELVSLNLKQVADLKNLTVVETAIALVQQGEVRVASFNMAPEDVENFMVQPWVVTSSDGTNGHPRKYASFPKKYQSYVVKKKLLSLGEFITRSSSKTAKLLGLEKRGTLKKGYQADIIIFDPVNFSAKADFSQWNQLSTGIEHVLVNGNLTISDSVFQKILAGEVVK